MEIIKDKISINKLKNMAREYFSNLVKAVVDIERKIMAVNGELHADEETLLIESGSKPENLWGINIYPEFSDSEKRIEFDSMINIKPHLNNRTRGVDDVKTRKKIIEVLSGLISDELPA